MQKCQFIVGNSVTKVKTKNTEATEIIYNLLRYEIKNLYGLRTALMKRYKGNKQMVYSELERMKYKNFFNGDFFLTGFLDRVLHEFDQKSIPYEVNDLRLLTKESHDHKIKGVDFRDYQEEAILYAFEKERSILNIPTGGGKTLVSVGIVKKINKKTLFLTHKKDLLYQTHEVYEKTFKNVGIIGDGKFMEGDLVTIATVQTLSSLIKNDPDGVKDFFSQFEVLIVDEAHRCASDQFVLVISNCVNAQIRVGLTATPFLKSQEENMYLEGLIGNNVYTKDSTDLVDDGTIAKPFFKFIPIKTEEINTDNWHEVYRVGIVENDERNATIAMEAIERHEKGDRILIIVTAIEHGEILHGLLSNYGKCMFMSGDKSAVEREKALKDLNSGKVEICIATNIFDEGVDVQSINCVILAAGTKSAPAFFQRVGRAVRKKKDNKALIIDFIDYQNKSLLSHSLSRYELVKSKNYHILRHDEDYDKMEV